MKSARIAQMESSRIVGGRAQTQALLRAPDRTSRTVTTGACPPSGSRGVKYATPNSFPALPAGSIRGALLESPDPFHPSLQKFSSIERALIVVNSAAALVFAVFLLFAKLP